MTRLKKQRLYYLISLGLLMGIGVTLILVTFKDNLVFFYMPSEIKEKGSAPEGPLRIGGLVKEKSVSYHSDSLAVHFVITDTFEEIPVRYDGILPDLFKEGQGVVAEGTLIKGHLKARTVLAKHDETYMPPEVAKGLDAAKKKKLNASLEGL